MCLGELTVEFPEWTSTVATLHLETLCCCDMQGHTNGEGMSLVLASPSSASYTVCVIIQTFVI